MLSRLPLIGVALLAATPTLSLRAQLPGDSVRATVDSASIMPGARAPRRSVGAAVAVIDAEEIAASGARTLSELLMARVPGLSVRPRGGTEASGSELRARGLVTPLQGRFGPAPILVIDGIMADARLTLAVPGSAVTLSRLDDLAPADVERIEVLRGPAASALYGLGAAAGVIVVTTRRGSSGPIALDAAAGVGLTNVDADFPANYLLTEGTTKVQCSTLLFNVTPAPCTNPTLAVWNPLEQASPFRTGRSTTSRAAVSGTTIGARVFLGATGERTGGVTEDDRHSRVGLRASVERALPGHLTMRAHGGYVAREARVTTDNIIARAQLGTAFDDATRGFLPTSVGQLRPTAPASPSLARTTAALALEWQPLAWLTMDALGGQDRDQSTNPRPLTGDFGGGTMLLAATRRDRWTSGTMHLGAEARYGVGSRLALTTRLAYDDVHLRIDEQVGNIVRSSSGDVRFDGTAGSGGRQRTQDATFRQHIRWSDLLSVNVGTRWSEGEGVGRPLAVEAARSIDALWRLPSPRSWLELRLRAAAGVARLPFPNLVPSSISSDYCTVATCPAPRRLRPRRGEREAGLDGTFGEGGRLAVTWFDGLTRDIIVGYGTGGSAGGGVIDRAIVTDVRNRGLEILGSARLLHGPMVGWSSTLSVATLRSRTVNTARANHSYNSHLVPGYPLLGYWRRDHRWTDANGDGQVAAGEVQLQNTFQFVGPSAPTLELGLRNSVTVRRALSLGALLDYRGGHYRDNLSEARRCRLSAHGCRALQDLAVPLPEQAFAVAASGEQVRFIEPASFLRLREVVLDWTLPQRMSSAVGAARLSVRVAGQNLGTWSRYPGPDPEVGQTPASTWDAPVELFDTPLPRRVLLEIRIGAGLGRP
jgi:TonB-dependent SusC/RagA subfamily outer membrane receptor